MNTDVNSTQGEWVGMGQGSEVYRWEALLVERGLVLEFLSAPSGLSQPPRVSHNHPPPWSLTVLPGLSQPAPPTVSHSPLGLSQSSLVSDSPPGLS